MARNKLRITFDYDGTALEAYSPYDLKHDDLSHATGTTDPCPGAATGIYFRRASASSSLWLSMGGGWYELKRPSNPTGKKITVKVNRNGQVKSVRFWRDDIGYDDDRDDTDDDDGTPPADQQIFFKMCPHGGTLEFLDKKLTLLAACRWIRIGATWYCIPI